MLQCLLERAIRVAHDDPAEAVRLLGVVAHNRDGIAFLDGVSYDTDSLLSDLRRALGDGEVQRILDATEGQELPDAPGWPPISSRPAPVPSSTWEHRTTRRAGPC